MRFEKNFARKALAIVLVLLAAMAFMAAGCGKDPDPAVSTTTAAPEQAQTTKRIMTTQAPETTEAETEQAFEGVDGVNSTYLSRMGITYGALRNALNDPKYSFTHAARYEVWDNGIDVNYEFDGIDRWLADMDSDWSTGNEDRCFTIMGTAGDLLPMVTGSTTPDAIASQLDVYCETREGGGTAYWISDRFAEMELPVRTADDKQIYLQIDLGESGRAVTKNSVVWLVAPAVIDPDWENNQGSRD